MKHLNKIVLIFIVFGLFLPGQKAMAVDFNNGYIISDSDLTDYGAMDLAEIQLFLEKKNSGLASRKFLNKDGIERTAPEIIWQAAIDYKISPKFLLVLMQKEQSLVEDETPTQKQFDWAMGFGVCDGCDPDSDGVVIFKGFGTQIDRAAFQHRYYLDNKTLGWLKKTGGTYTIDGIKVTIANQATANLYNYTPHIHGNYLFWKIWNRWFFQKYPDGSLLQIENEKGVWLIQNGQKRPFLSKSAFLSKHQFKDVVVVGKIELDKYELGNPIKFPNYSLLRTPLGNSFMLIDDQLRKFESNDVIKTIGFNPEEFEELTLEDFDLYSTGELITLASAYPSGALLQNKKTGGVYFVQDGKKHPIISKDILKINFPAYHLTPVYVEELEKYPLSDEVKIKDGVLIKSNESSAVYVVSEGKKRPIASAKVFEKLKYNWKNIAIVSEKSLSNLLLGAMIDFDYGN